jgi:abhydrolase domain-containing protein 17
MSSFGQSLGSSTSINYLQNNKEGIVGIVLISPIASGLKIAFNERVSNELEKCDVFCNDQKIKNISIPVFIIHGKKDELINVSDCQAMAKKAKNALEWYPNEGTHNNIIDRYRKKFYEKVKLFMDQIINSIPKENKIDGNMILEQSKDDINKSYLISKNKYKN